MFSKIRELHVTLHYYDPTEIRDWSVITRSETKPMTEPVSVREPIFCGTDKSALLGIHDVVEMSWGSIVVS